MKQVQDTELFRHMIRWLASESSFCKEITSLGDKDGLPEIAANVCCKGAELLTGKHRKICCKEMNVQFLNINGERPAAVVSGTLIANGNEQGIDMLVPLCQTNPSNLCEFDQGCCSGVHPSTADVLTVLLFALPQDTWAGIKEERLKAEMNSLVSIESLPPLLKDEVLSI